MMVQVSSVGVVLVLLGILMEARLELEVGSLDVGGGFVG